MIITSKDFDFEGSGYKGAKFEKKGMEERNLSNLLKILSNKTTQKSIEALAKIDKTQWKDIALVAVSLRGVVEGGGLGAFGTQMTANIKETIELQIDSLMAPLTNEITAAINIILNPFIQEYLMPLINELSAFLSENKVGAGVGGIIGGIAGIFVPGGPLVGSLVGAIVGGVIEAMFTSDITGAPDLTSTELIESYKFWLLAHPGGTIGDYYRYLQEGAGTNSYLPGENDYRSGR